MAPDIFQRSSLPFPRSLPEFQKLFPNDAACAAYLERIRWDDGFACPHCGTQAEPFHCKTWLPDAVPVNGWPPTCASE